MLQVGIQPQITMFGRSVYFLAMTVIHEAKALESFGKSTLVPTMGALHEGHLSLIRMAAERGRPVVVSIFVNPTQFAPHEDFATYPRTLQRDVESSLANGADVIYAPGVQDIYPRGLAAANEEAAKFPLPDVARTPGLEDGSRPHFFGGVCLVVARLFDLVQPSEAIFGEKDWQQLKSVQAMARETPRFAELCITPGPTVREKDGLAMSSRNVHLQPDQRHTALGLKAALDAVMKHEDPHDAEEAMDVILSQRGLRKDYAVVRDADTLGPPTPSRPTRALIAARLEQPEGDVRLIDNAPALPCPEFVLGNTLQKP